MATIAQDRVEVFGSKAYRSHLLLPERAVSQDALVEFEKELKGLLDRMWDVYEAKGSLYDQATPVWHHFPFGLSSFGTLMYLKATRFVSLLQKAEALDLTEIEDTLKDLAMYTWYAWAYARLVASSAAGGE